MITIDQSFWIAIQALATAALVAITAYYARQVKNTLGEMTRARQLGPLPSISCRLQAKPKETFGADNEVEMEVTNVGNSAAFELQAVIKQIDAGQAWLQMSTGNVVRKAIWTLRADGSTPLTLPVIQSPSNRQTARLEITFTYCNLYGQWFKTTSIHESEYRSEDWATKSENTQLTSHPPPQA
jgi:hypothetical protein